MALDSPFALNNKNGHPTAFLPPPTEDWQTAKGSRLSDMGPTGMKMTRMDFHEKVLCKSNASPDLTGCC
jgi:hypothetical protein